MNNDLITRFAEKQKHVWCCCPRCGSDSMDKDVSKNALSRRADVMICNICGNVEAIEDMPGSPKLSMDTWALNEHPERFFLKGKDYFSFYFTFGSWEGFPFNNCYIVVEGFDREDARERYRRRYPDKTPGIACYAFDYDQAAWDQTEMSKAWPCAGVLHLNGAWEVAE